MPRFFDPIFKVIARAREPQFVAHIQFLKAENQILRSRIPGQIRLTDPERRRLVRLGKHISWSAMKELITVVHHRTFTRWIRNAIGVKRNTKKNNGRPLIPDEIRKLVLRIAHETGLGYTRIQGELNKLGIIIARSTIKNILKREGISPDPYRGEGQWHEFIKIHAKTLWACDFLSVKAWTRYGLVEHYMILFIHIASRRIYVTSVTSNPAKEWVNQQSRNFCMVLSENNLQADYLIHDRDCKFTQTFHSIMKSNGTNTIKLPIQSPNLNAFAERVIQSLKQECLNHFVILGEKHLNHLVQEYVEFYNHERPHSSIGFLPPIRDGTLPTSGDIRCKERLGGLLKHYYRSAA